MIFSTIEDEAALSGLRITSIFESIQNSAQGIEFDDSFKSSLAYDTNALKLFKQEIDSGISKEQAFINTLSDASSQAQIYANEVNTDSFDTNKFIEKQRMAQVSSIAQNKSLKNSISLISEYNSSLKSGANGITSCGLKQKDFVNSIKESNTTLGNYLTNLNGSKGSILGYTGNLIKAKAATFAPFGRGRRTPICPLAVPETAVCLSRPRRFNHGANSCSLHPPPAALASVARMQFWSSCWESGIPSKIAVLKPSTDGKSVLMFY